MGKPKTTVRKEVGRLDLDDLTGSLVEVIESLRKIPEMVEFNWAGGDTANSVYGPWRKFRLERPSSWHHDDYLLITAERDLTPAELKRNAAKRKRDRERAERKRMLAKEKRRKDYERLRKEFASD
jgi:hypothetical protein